MSDSESTGAKYDSDDSFFDPTAEYGWLGEYGKLLRACGFMGSAKAARRLLDAGVPIKGPRGEPTPLACAIQHNMVDIARLLVARGADVNNDESVLRRVSGEVLDLAPRAPRHRPALSRPAARP